MQEKFKRQNEKAAIVTRFIRRKGKKAHCPLYYSWFIKQWYVWFKKDFGTSDPTHMGESLDTYFKEVFNESCQKWENISSPQMDCELEKLRTHEDIQPWVWRVANKQGLSVWKRFDLKKHPCCLSGFTITNPKTHKIIAGKCFDLSLAEVKSILNVKDRNESFEN